MIQIPITEVISKIVAQAGISEKDIKKKIDEKIKTLNELVSEEGAAYIIASELNVKLFEDPATTILKIKDAHIGMNGVEIVAKISRVFDTRNFQRDGRTVNFVPLMLQDETGSIRTTLWDKRADLVLEDRLKLGDVVRIKGASIKENKFTGKELQLSIRSQIMINQDELEVDITVVPSAQEIDLSNPVLGAPVNLTGTIVSVSEPRFYNSCTECNRKVSDDKECKQHGAVETPKLTMILNFVLDDGKGNIRATCFGKLGETLLGEKADIIQELVSVKTPEEIGEPILGQVVEVAGIIRENEQFERNEMNVNKVKIINADELILRLNK